MNGNHVEVTEVGLRDGLQMVKTILSTEQKLEWCRRLVAAGCTNIEVTSFVPPRIAPQFADSDDVARGALAIAGIHASALVPNLKGAQRAFNTGLSQVHYVLSASNEHNLKNVRRSTAESVDDFSNIVAARDATGRPGIHLGAGVATAFG